MLTIPLTATANQTLAVQLSNQTCQIDLQQRGAHGEIGLFMNLFVAGQPIVQGVKCLDRNRIVRDLYLGFLGDLAFFDTQGSDDPFYTGLGARWQLLYIEPGELPPGVG